MLSLAAACDGDNGAEDGDDGFSSALVDAYLRAECRFYTESDCITAAEEDCAGGFGQTETVDACVGQLRSLLQSYCPAFFGEINANEADVDACIDSMTALDCVNDRPVCDENEHGNLELLNCGTVKSIYTSTCPAN